MKVYEQNGRGKCKIEARHATKKKKILLKILLYLHDQMNGIERCKVYSVSTYYLCCLAIRIHSFRKKHKS